MKRVVLVIREACRGWHLIDRDEPVLWFPEKDAALHVAKTIADARNFYSGAPTAVEVEMGDHRERVAAFT